jgi:formylmethanofuran dehydrogenase subunit E
MPLSNDKVQAIKTCAAGKDVIILMEGGQTVTGILSEVTPEHVRLESKEDVTFLTTDVIKALRIRK